MTSFKGTYPSTIDDKRRLKLPKKLRSAMPASDAPFVMGPGYDGCIFLFPADEWEKQEQKLRSLKVDLKEHRFLERVFVPESEDTRMDDLGRLTVSQRLLDGAQIKKDVLILGVLSRIELWAPQVYQTYRERYQESYEDVAERIFKA
ncbi:MAG: division/cell wall cluster transcriptional repressor MraZ [Candidatus Zixiibacteriota bacterium]